MTSRYDNRKVVKNQDAMYKSLFKKRGIRFINQYKTAKLHFPTGKEQAQLSTTSHIWKSGDKYYKLASLYYGDPSLWWVIAWFNRRPTEANIYPGQSLLIPQPLDAVLPLLMQTGS
jgi:nucleoid-associated protein YgaU